jgi:hypothetical protein
MAARPNAISAVPPSAPGVIGSPSTTRPSSNAETGISNVTNDKLVAPALASTAKKMM